MDGRPTDSMVLIPPPPNHTGGLVAPFDEGYRQDGTGPDFYNAYVSDAEEEEEEEGEGAKGEAAAAGGAGGGGGGGRGEDEDGMGGCVLQFLFVLVLLLPSYSCVFAA